MVNSDDRAYFRTARHACRKNGKGPVLVYLEDESPLFEE